MITPHRIQYGLLQLALAFAASLIISSAIYIFAPGAKRLPLKKVLLRFAFIFYAAFLLVLTLSPQRDMGVPPNFTPLSTVLEAAGGSGTKKLVAVLNVLAFVPLGIFLRTVFGVKRFYTALAVCAAATLFIEVMQMLLPLNRIFDVDDILLNTLGGMAGYGVCALIDRARRGTQRM